MILFYRRAIVLIGLTDATDNKTETPLDILKRRYARGEIDKEEYKTKKRDLSLTGGKSWTDVM